MEHICYYFYRVNVPLWIGLFLLIFICIMAFLLMRMKADHWVLEILGIFKAFFISLPISIVLLCGICVFSEKISPRHVGILYKMDMSWDYIPKLEALCTDEGYQTDEYGIPLFDSYDAYREWYCEKFPEYAYFDMDYADSDY